MSDEHYKVIATADDRNYICHHQGHAFRMTELGDGTVRWYCPRCGYEAIETPRKSAETRQLSV